MSRPRFTPTAEQRKLVANLAGINCTQEEIIECVHWGNPGDRPIDQKTLRRHFGAELARGKALAHMRVKKKIADMIERGSVAMTIFYAKVHFGWKETVAVETTGKDGAPLPAAQMVLYLPSKDPLPEGVPLTIDLSAASSPAAVLDAPPLATPERRTAPAQPRQEAPPESRAVGAVGPRGVMYPTAVDMRR